MSALVVVVALVAACAATTEPRDATPFTPPAKYAVHWRVVESCSGVTRDFAAVKWFTVVGSADRSRERALGAWFPHSNSIYLNEALVDDDELVRHEMLHAVLRDPRPSHPRAFVEECGGLVHCDGDCLAEVGGPFPAPGPTSPLYPPESLVVSSYVITPSASEDGWLAVVIRATSPRTFPVRIDLSGKPGIQFECRVNSGLCGRRFTYGTNPATFYAGERRSEATVFQLPPGTHSVVGWFNTVSTPAETVQVPPR